MVTEQDKTPEALQIAIQMEIDGKEYYLRASQESSNELGKKLLQSLAAEEDIHRQKFVRDSRLTVMLSLALCFTAYSNNKEHKYVIVEHRNVGCPFPLRVAISSNGGWL